MKPVSARYKADIYAKTRQTKAEVTFSFVDPEAKGATSIISTPPQSATSKPLQMLDDNRNILGKVAQFEPNYWKLDGSFLLPRPATETSAQYGFWTQALSDAGGNIPSQPYIRFYFSEPVSLPGITITFDSASGQYLKDFNLIAYDESLTVLRQENVRNNGNVVFVLAKGVSGVKYVDIVFLKTSTPQRRVRIEEIDWGISIIFSGSSLYKLNLISECDPLSETIPDNEMNLSAHNENGRFNYTDPESFQQYLQKDQLLDYVHSLVEGEEEEPVSMGKYALLSWDVNDMEVNLKARLSLSALEQTPFRRYSLTTTTSAGELLETIFEEAGWLDYDIDSYLYSSPAIIPYTGEVDCKEALRLVAFFAGAVVIKMPTGQIRVTRIDYTNDTVDTVNYAAQLQAAKAQSSKYYNSIKLQGTNVTEKTVESGKYIAEFTGIAPGVFWVPYNYVLLSGGTTTISGATLSSATLYANYALITVTGSGAFTFRVSGKTADFNTFNEIVYAPWHQTGEKAVSYDMKVPMLIQGATYEAAKDWMCQERFRVLANRLIVDLDWRQNPAQDIGDYVDIQLDKTGGSTEIFMIQQELNYSGGALKGAARGVGQGTNQG